MGFVVVQMTSFFKKVKNNSNKVLVLKGFGAIYGFLNFRDNLRAFVGFFMV